MASAAGESMVKYRSCWFENLTFLRNPEKGHCQAGSLTGVVASQRVTEAFKGPLRANRNQPQSAPYRDWETDRKSTRLNSSHSGESRMPSSA